MCVVLDSVTLVGVDNVVKVVSTLASVVVNVVTSVGVHERRRVRRIVVTLAVSGGVTCCMVVETTIRVVVS